MNVKIVLRNTTPKRNTVNRVRNDLEILELKFEANATERREGKPEVEMAATVETVAMTNWKNPYPRSPNSVVNIIAINKP